MNLMRLVAVNSFLPLLKVLVALHFDDSGHGDFGNVDIAVAVAVVKGDVLKWNRHGGLRLLDDVGEIQVTEDRDRRLYSQSS